MWESIEPVIKLFLDSLSKKIKINSVYIFGSRVRDDWLKHSDIDLIIISDDFKDMPFIKRIDIIEEVQWKNQIRPHIEVIPLTLKEFNEKINSSAILMNASRYWKKIL
ncbi:MAG: nucleotidyltransferase domain-containing protein [Thermoprotei archaeon]|jgi:predicted nucleotidyltransferase